MDLFAQTVLQTVTSAPIQRFVSNANLNTSWLIILAKNANKPVLIVVLHIRTVLPVVSTIIYQLIAPVYLANLIAILVCSLIFVLLVTQDFSPIKDCASPVLLPSVLSVLIILAVSNAHLIILSIMGHAIFVLKTAKFAFLILVFPALNVRLRTILKIRQKELYASPAWVIARLAVIQWAAVNAQIHIFMISNSICVCRAPMESVPVAFQPHTALHVI